MDINSDKPSHKKREKKEEEEEANNGVEKKTNVYSTLWFCYRFKGRSELGKY